MTNEELWNHVRQFSEWLDRDSAPMEDPRIMRAFKLAEEVGEVAAAVIGVTGQNPRKGVTHSWEDVQDELCDVILTAMVALDCVTGDAQERFAAHVKKRNARMLDLTNPKAELV